MHYNAYLECTSKGLGFHRVHIDNQYKTLRGLTKRIQSMCEDGKNVVLGKVLFTSKNHENRYKRENYNIIEQFNAKAFFEYWN